MIWRDLGQEVSQFEGATWAEWNAPTAKTITKQRSAEASTNHVRTRLVRWAELSNRVRRRATEKTWTPILVIKGVYYKSFLHSVAVYLTTGHHCPSVTCLAFMNDQKIRIFPVDQRTVRFRRFFSVWAPVFGLSIVLRFSGNNKLTRANVNSLAG